MPSKNNTPGSKCLLKDNNKVKIIKFIEQQIRVFIANLYKNIGYEIHLTTFNMASFTGFLCAEIFSPFPAESRFSTYQL